MYCVCLFISKLRYYCGIPTVNETNCQTKYASRATNLNCIKCTLKNLLCVLDNAYIKITFARFSVIVVKSSLWPTSRIKVSTMPNFI